MKNPTGKKLEKVVFGIFDQMVEGADKYVTKQGSTWLIFTESKKWVIEFTKDKTLWFNYNMFQSELELIGKDSTEEIDLIKSWFESRFLNKPKVKEAHHVDVMKFFDKKMENTIKNGVRATFHHAIDSSQAVEDTIHNGVKLIDSSLQIDGSCVIEDVIQEGVKYTFSSTNTSLTNVEDTIQNGVKETKESMLESSEQKDHLATTFEITENINDAIENGVKEIREVTFLNQMFIEETIQDGVKELKVWKSNRCEEHGYFEFVDGIPTYTPMTQVKDVLENGVKEIQPLPARDGNRDWGLYYHRQEDRTKPHTEYVKEVIEDSYNHRGRVEGVIRNTNKDGI